MLAAVTAVLLVHLFALPHEIMWRFNVISQVE
jgi:hypothetical protein